MDLIDKAVSNKWVGIVVLSGSGDASGGRLYEAACMLKSVVGERAYLLVAERVDIAAAASASGVLLSDQGFLPINYLFITTASYSNCFLSFFSLFTISSNSNTLTLYSMPIYVDLNY